MSCITSYWNPAIRFRMCLHWCYFTITMHKSLCFIIFALLCFASVFVFHSICFQDPMLLVFINIKFHTTLTICNRIMQRIENKTGDFIFHGFHGFHCFPLHSVKRTCNFVSQMKPRKIKIFFLFWEMAKAINKRQLPNDHIIRHEISLNFRIKNVEDVRSFSPSLSMAIIFSVQFTVHYV